MGVTVRAKRVSAATAVLGVAVVTAINVVPSAADSGSPSCFGETPTIVRGGGDNAITGTEGRDVIVAGGGNDVVKALGGRDRICAGSGRDKVHGGHGADDFFGDDGSDRLFGGGGGDDVRGQNADDVLEGEGGRDELNGGKGSDTCVTDPRDGDELRKCEGAALPPTS